MASSSSSRRELFSPAVSITMTKRRRFFWAAWWSSAPAHVPFVKPDASDGGFATYEDAQAAAEKRAGGLALSPLDPLWARAWIRILRGEAAWPSKSSREPTTNPQATATATATKEEGSPPLADEEPTSIWSILGVNRNTVTLNELKAAYRARVLEAHPDQGGKGDQFQRVMRAYAEAQRRIKKPQKKKTTTTTKKTTKTTASRSR
jgi:hypothetical protein